MLTSINRGEGELAATAPIRVRLINRARAIIPGFISTRELASEIVAIAIDGCESIEPLLAKHDRWMAHNLTHQEARRRAAACGVFVPYTCVFDRHGLRARTLLPGIASSAEHAPEFIGTDIAGHLRMYDQDRVESVVRLWGNWSKHESDGGAGLRWFGAIFFDNESHPEAADAYYAVRDQLEETIRKRLLRAYWIG